MKVKFVLGVVLTAIILAIPVSATSIQTSNAIDQQILLFNLMSNKVADKVLKENSSTNLTEMNINLDFYLDINGDGKDDVVSTKIKINNSIESKIKIGNISFSYAGIAIAYPIDDINNDGLKDILVNKMFGINEPSEVAIFSKEGFLWNYSKEQSLLLAVPNSKDILVSQITMSFMHPSTQVIKFNGKGNKTMEFEMSGLGYALPMDDINSDDINDVLVTKIVDVTLNGYSTSGIYAIDGKTGEEISKYLEVSEKDVVTTIAQVINDLDGDGVKDIMIQTIKQNKGKDNSTNLSVLLKVVSSKKLVKSQKFDDALLWEKEYENFVTATITNDANGDGLSDILVSTYKPKYPSTEIVYPMQTRLQAFDYEFDILRGYDGKLLSHFEFNVK
ncbi:MAG: VCBS repeat-containing protein [Archaeoglobaceae archaeon]|nr:VCBS repeat-containing protein [Archaeoglobaceae archaeon]